MPFLPADSACPLFAPGGTFYTLSIKITLPAACGSPFRLERRYNLL
jgi:hypothetical protein